MKSILGSLALGLLLALAYGALSLYQASRDNAIAPNEATATAYIHQHYGTSANHASNTLRCDYSFSVNGTPYVGHSPCSTAGSTKEALEDLAGLRPDTNSTVYYDPNDPTTNSLVEFGARVGDDYMRAKVGFALAAACILFLGIGIVITAKAGQSGGGMMVDAQGTMLYPDQIKSDPDDERFSAHPTHISSEKTD